MSRAELSNYRAEPRDLVEWLSSYTPLVAAPRNDSLSTLSGKAQPNNILSLTQAAQFSLDGHLLGKDGSHGSCTQVECSA